MADRVIVVGTKRASTEIDPRDMKQMLGRAGRAHGKTAEAHVHIVLPNADVISWQNKMTSEESFEVRSELSDLMTLSFHVVCQVVRKVITDEQSFYDWYNYTLDKIQRDNRGLPLPSYEETMLELQKLGAVELDPETKKVKAKPLGRVAASLYFSPYEVRDWFVNLLTLNDKSYTRYDSCQAWMLANTRGGQGWDSKEVTDAAGNLVERLENMGLKVRTGSIGKLYATACVLNGSRPRCELPEYPAVLGDFDRVVRAFEMITKISTKIAGNQDHLIETIKLRRKYGVSTRLVDLVKHEGIGKAAAKELYEVFEVENIHQMMDRWDLIRDECSSGLKRAMTSFKNSGKKQVE